MSGIDGDPTEHFLRPFLERSPRLNESLLYLIALGLAWNLRDGSTRPVAIGLAVVALLVLAGLLHPRSIEALERAAADRR